MLHTADPGASGTEAIAKLSTADIVRKAIAFNAPVNNTNNSTKERKCTLNGAISWSGEEIDSGQTITHFTIWDGADGSTPNVEFIAAVAAQKITGSDGVAIADTDIKAAIEVHDHIA